MDIVVAIPVAVFLVIVGLLAFRMVKYRGTSGALFQSRITRTVGALNVVSTPLELRVKVHALQKQEPGWVGVEFERFNGRSWQISPLALSKSEALRLSDLLAEAARSA